MWSDYIHDKSASSRKDSVVYFYGRDKNKNIAIDSPTVPAYTTFLIDSDTKVNSSNNSQAYSESDVRQPEKIGNNSNHDTPKKIIPSNDTTSGKNEVVQCRKQETTGAAPISLKSPKPMLKKAPSYEGTSKALDTLCRIKTATETNDNSNIDLATDLPADAPCRKKEISTPTAVRMERLRTLLTKKGNNLQTKRINNWNKEVREAINCKIQQMNPVKRHRPKVERIVTTSDIANTPVESEVKAENDMPPSQKMVTINSDGGLKRVPLTVNILIVVSFRNFNAG